MTNASDLTGDLTNRYDTAASKWRDKMRALGYYDGYLGFLSAPGAKPETVGHVIDMGAGTAAFAEAWVAVNGPPQQMTLVDPSNAMLERGAAALQARGVAAQRITGLLGETPDLAKADELLLAHVIEHCDDPATALSQCHDLLNPGGRLFLVVSKPHWCNAIIWLQWRHRTFSHTEIYRLLEIAGFTGELDYTFPSGPPSRTSRGIIARRK